jgi:hypothetical protein
MMIDINLNHAELLMFPLQEDTAEHYDYLDELNALDFKIEEDALYAIRKWLIPNPEWSAVGMYQLKEVCRYCLIKGYPFGSVWLPGISGIGTGFGQPNDVGDMEKWEILSTKFHLLLWYELFKEPFVPADLSQYRQRVDDRNFGGGDDIPRVLGGFKYHPDSPELWGEPMYEDWPTK